MTSSSDLAYVDKLNGRDYNSGAQVAFKSGASLDMESGAALKIAGTQVTSNATELNTLDGISTTWLAKFPGSHTITPGAESCNSINVTVQLNDITGTAIAASKVVRVYLSDSSAGDGLASAVPDGDVAIGTDGTILSEPTTDKEFWIWTESDGQFDLDIGETSDKTFYLVLCDGFNIQIATLDFD